MCGSDQGRQLHKELLAARQVLQVIVQNVNLTANGSLRIGHAEGVEGAGLYCGPGDRAVGELNLPKSNMRKLTIG